MTENVIKAVRDWLDSQQQHPVHTQIQTVVESCEEQKQLLEETTRLILETRSELNSLIDDAPLAYLTVSDQGTIYRANRQAALLFGEHEPEKLLLKKFAGFVLEEDQYLWNDFLFQSLHTQHSRKLRLEGQDDFWVSISSSPEKQGRFVRLALNDLRTEHRLQAELANRNRILDEQVLEKTAQLAFTNEQLRQEVIKAKAAEQALRDERDLFLKGPVVLFKWRRTIQEGRLRTLLDYVSPNLAQFGLKAADIPSGSAWYERVHPDDREHLAQQAAVNKDTEFFGGTYRIKKGDGSWVWVYDFSHLQNTTEGETEWYGYILDINDRIEAYREHRQTAALMEGGLSSQWTTFEQVIKAAKDNYNGEMTINRLNGIITIYSTLPGCLHSGKIQMGQFIQALVNHLLSVDDRPAPVKISVQNPLIEVAQAVYLGCIITELLTAGLSHDELLVTGHTNDTRIEVLLRGQTFAPQELPASTSRFIACLSEAMHALTSFDNTEGWQYHIAFPKSI